MKASKTLPALASSYAFLASSISSSARARTLPRSWAGRRRIPASDATSMDRILPRPGRGVQIFPELACLLIPGGGSAILVAHVTQGPCPLDRLPRRLGGRAVRVRRGQALGAGADGRRDGGAVRALPGPAARRAAVLEDGAVVSRRLRGDPAASGGAAALPVPVHLAAAGDARRGHALA